MFRKLKQLVFRSSCQVVLVIALQILDRYTVFFVANILLSYLYALTRSSKASQSGLRQMVKQKVKAEWSGKGQNTRNVGAALLPQNTGFNNMRNPI